MSFLGAGFRLAMKDLEIRGAGNLLGPQQSGHIHAVGMDLYMEMLEKAVADLKGVERKEEVDPAISLAVAAFIPSEYIEDVTIRLGMYRRVANAREEVALDEMKAEMRDRFGALPPEVKGLFEVMRLKLVARTLRVSSLSEGSGRARFTFAEDTPATPERILALQQVFRGIRFHKNGFDLPLKQGSVEDRCGTLRDILGRLL
jgi:transcription-repair coupling factor (superfamily II helicase)